MVLSSKPSSLTTTENIFRYTWKLLIFREKNIYLDAYSILNFNPTSFLVLESICDATCTPIPLTNLNNTS
jgi:hypothetical protein